MSTSSQRTVYSVSHCFQLNKSFSAYMTSSRRPKKKRNIQNDTRIKASIQRFDSGAYTRLQFLRAMCHCLGAHTEAFQFASDASDDDADDGADAVAPDDASSQRNSAANPDNAAQSPGDDAVELCEVCLLAPRSGVALVPCGHSRFCVTCADTVAAMDSRCPICRTPISMVLLRLFN